MKEKINVAELLKNCPKGMELDCVMYDKVELIGVDEICITPFPIKVSRGDGLTMTLTKYGQYTDADFAKCVIFPKGKTTWEGFVPPCKFKDGDICYMKTEVSEYIFIFKVSADCHYIRIYVNLSKIDFLHIGGGNTVCDIKAVKKIRLATEEEKQKLFDAIKARGYKWNPETKTLKKLIEPKFKVGDRIRHKVTNKDDVYEISEVYDDSYGLVDFTWMIYMKYQDDYELVPNKFDITTLKPFESRVLVRDKNTDEWRGQFFSHYYESKRSNKPYICIGVEGLCEYKQCIPFENNEYLLGTTNDCDDFYKTWE